MKKLEVTFVSGEGGFSVNPLTYNQIKRFGDYAIYERSRDGKVYDYEVIHVTVAKQGKQVFNTVVDEDTEEYPSASKFGKHGWGYPTLAAAEAKFNELLKQNISGVVPVKTTRGRVKRTRPVLVFPKEKQFTVNDLFDLNKQGWTRIEVSNELSQLFKTNKAKKVGVAASVGKGKKPNIWELC